MQTERTQSESTLLNVHGGDRVAAWFLVFGNGKPVLARAGVVFVIGIAPVVVSWFEGGFDNPRMTLDMSRDFAYWGVFILGSTVLAVLLPMFFCRLPGALKEIGKGGIVRFGNSESASPDAEREFWLKANSLFQNPLARVGPWVIGAAVMLFGYFFFVQSGYFTWHVREGTIGEPSWTGFAHLPAIFLFFYLAGVGFFRIPATMAVLERFFSENNRVEIQPLHADGCGGLEPLGKISMQLNYGVAAFGLISALGILGNCYNFRLPGFHGANIAIVMGYVLVSVCVFFLPLNAATTQMRAAKVRCVLAISRRFDAVNSTIMKQLSKGRPVSKDQIEEIENLRKLHDFARGMPVYPFNASTVSWFSVSLLTPLTLHVLEMLANRIAGAK